MATDLSRLGPGSEEAGALDRPLSTNPTSPYTSIPAAFISYDLCNFPHIKCFMSISSVKCHENFSRMVLPLSSFYRRES